MIKFATLVLCCLLVTCFVSASSHSEAPGTAETPAADVTDFYMFQCYEEGKEDHTCFIINANPLQNPFAGPNYFTLSDDHFFEIYVDNDGDAREDITFQMYTGNRLGGVEIEVPFESDEDDCFVQQRSAAPLPLTTTKHGGFTLNIGGRDIAIPLKFFAPITAGDNSGANWFEWFSMNVVYGDRSFGEKSEVTLMGNSSVTQFSKPLDYAGTKSFPDYAAYADQYIHTINIPGCGPARAFLGQRRESFIISIGAIFDLINMVPIAGIVPETLLNNDLEELSVTSFVLEIPTECLVSEGSDVIGAWSGVRELHHNGEEHVAGKQVSRLGMPLVNELFIGLRDKGRFNRMEPREDSEMVVEYIQYPTLPALVDILFLAPVNELLNETFTNIAPTNFPRMDLNAVFLTGLAGINKPDNVVASEMLRLNVSIPPTSALNQSQYGVLGGDLAGFPNGRRPGDDIVDIALDVAMGALCYTGLGFCEEEDAVIGFVPLSDGSPISAEFFFDEFPYVTTPLPGSEGIFAEQECNTILDCSIGEFCNNGTCVSYGYDCFNDTDCLLGEFCVYGFCELPSSCNTTLDCPINRFCDNGTCASYVFDCFNDTDCLLGEVCVYGFCELPSSCNTTLDCPIDQLCDNGTCASYGSDCFSATDCLLGEVCVYGFCELPSSCNITFDCPIDQFCDNGTCASYGYDCFDDIDCVEGEEICSYGFCEARETCVESADCTILSEICVNDFCVPPECYVSEDCEIGEFCNEGTCASP